MIDTAGFAWLFWWACGLLLAGLVVLWWRYGQ